MYPLESAFSFVLGKYPALVKVISLPSFRYPTVFLGSLLVSRGEVTETAMWENKPELDNSDLCCCFLEKAWLTNQSKTERSKCRVACHTRLG